MPFKALNLSAPVLRGIQAAGYTDPTPIQLRAIPIVLSGRDFIGSAQTGTGKTAAFALPILSKLGVHGRPRVLVLEPQRVNLLRRSKRRFAISRASPIFVQSRCSAVSATATNAANSNAVSTSLSRHRVACWIIYKDGALSLRDIQILVLDEVDRMLDMGFLPVVKDIIGRCPRERQTLFFSATVPPEIQAIASFALRNPERVEIGINRSVTASVNHALYHVAWSQKFELLAALLAKIDYDSVLVFSRTKHGADKIARRLKSANHSVAVLHANRSQNQRIEALAGFKSGKYEIMVATDIAARGIDVAGISHVINYDVPENPEDYVHRIGRTGRAQAVGDAFTLVTPENADDIRAIQRFIGQKIPELKLEGFNYEPLTARPAQPSGQGGRQGRGGQGGGGRPQGRAGGASYQGGGQGSGRGGRGRFGGRR